MERCLPNTFILFRHELKLAAPPRKATGWITGDSRYRLTVNGQYIQWGPAPCDPRWLEADPVDLTATLRAGKNVIGVEVCYFGQGDGTWPMGAPGLIVRLAVDGELIVSDSSWLTFLDRAHRPGMYKRWFLRALQEEFDARLHPYGWDTPPFRPDDSWLPARELPGSASTPAIFAGGPEYVLMPGAASDSDRPHLRKRAIPMLQETIVAAKRLARSGGVRWLRSPNDWFESRVPGSFKIERDATITTPGEHGIVVDTAGLRSTPATTAAAFLTFEYEEQLVGWPRFTIEAPAGAIVELVVRESHDLVNGPPWLDTYFYHWTRFICREGVNEFETFDYESFKWLQLHIRNASRPVTVSNVGARRRLYPWPNEAHIECAEVALQRLFDASINTLHNSCQETVVDGMGRERQQYSGDCGHQLHAVRYTFGETRLPARYLSTFSQGMTLDGYFLDCWPAFDRLARLMQRQMGATVWGPLLDHGVGFNFDCWNHYRETGDIKALREPYPRLLRFLDYLEKLRGKDGLLPVENIGVPTVWMDHDAYQRQRHKQCAFNLYAAAALQHALAPIARTLEEPARATRIAKLGAALQAATVCVFWDRKRCMFVNNLPWLRQEKSPRLCDRSLAMAILFDQCPRGETRAASRVLVRCPHGMGLSYPANAVWRYWALAKLGRTDVIVKELRERWATMSSVIHNNTLQENWTAERDGYEEFSHCALAPLIMLYQCLAGVRPTAPGFARCEIRPQLADLGDIKLVAHTPRGPLSFQAKIQTGGHEVSVTLPPRCEGVFLIPTAAGFGLKRFRLAPGKRATFFLPTQSTPSSHPRAKDLDVEIRRNT